MRLYSLFQVEAQQLQKEERSAALEQLPRHTADLAWGIQISLSQSYALDKFVPVRKESGLQYAELQTRAEVSERSGGLPLHFITFTSQGLQVHTAVSLVVWSCTLVYEQLAVLVGCLPMQLRAR